VVLEQWQRAQQLFPKRRIPCTLCSSTLTVKVVESMDNGTKNKSEAILHFLQRYNEQQQKSEAKLPYHINVIDELRANENAHSRILVKLLQQKTADNRFEILEGFVAFLVEKESHSFGNIKIENPTITQEIGRIDLWIRDKTYAIVVENKIHYANDGDKQLARYIEKTKEDTGFRDEQVFVLYLSPRSENPDEQSWGTYKKTFEERFLNLSFSEDIIYWLKEKLLPNLKLKDVYLRSAIEQYIDHLEGIFSLRTIDNSMNMELQQLIKKEWGLFDNPTNNLAQLLAKQKEINEVNNQINLLLNEANDAFYEKWQKEMSEEYPDYEKTYEKGSRAGVIVPIENDFVRVSISSDSQLYCQVDTENFEDKTLSVNMIERLKDLLPTLHKNESHQNYNKQIWKYFDRCNYIGVYECFQKVMKVLTEK
jgi:predicted DNA-binding protein